VEIPLPQFFSDKNSTVPYLAVVPRFVRDTQKRLKILLTSFISIDISNKMTSTQIKALRKSLGLTQQGLADMVAATQVTVARWETGVNEPKGAYLKALNAIATTTKVKTKIKR
jgi:DNA-binding transcriptional regulator YiaG